ncbi:hypothetical protein AVU90_gp62 [Enterococcus phage IME-EFm5]|uniref:Uncharacterized protein n=1 Tax=Enterococcus phage IME-EFm5 TaxID=1718158 RepID=A0A0M5M1F3_9CAUD|nr:hypothetical protein AVU90_gp62 [Enterococcus phage IME-EFm5]ALF02031.1 hypothetical protein EFm5_62 [Enterococcus phage IME-EFm5]
MTHEKYNELQKKMDKLYSDFVDLGADIEKRGDDMNKLSEWLDNNIQPIINWAKDHDAEEEVLDELQADHDKLKEMLEC